MKFRVDRFTLQAKLDWLTWQYYTGGADQASLEAEIAQTREAIRRLLQSMPLDENDPPELQANLALAKIEVESDVSHLRGIFEYNNGDLASETAAHHLLELCRLRNQHACAQGYASYPQLALEVQGLSDKDNPYYRSVLRYLRKPAVKDSIEPDIPCMEEYWGILEEQLGPRPHGICTPNNYHLFLKSLLEVMGLSDAAEHLEVVVAEQPYAAGVAFDLSQGSSPHAGILIRPVGVSAFFTAAHELGHALLYLHRPGAHSVIPAWLDEGYAHLIEDDECLIRTAFQRLSLDDKRITEWLAVHRRFHRIEHNRIWASILTEDALWVCADRSDLTDEEKIAMITDQCAGFYRQYLGTTYANPLRWALDSFRSVDPVYVHSYALARDFAVLMLEEPASMPARYDTSLAAITAIIGRISDS